MIIRINNMHYKVLHILAVMTLWRYKDHINEWTFQKKEWVQ